MKTYLVIHSHKHGTNIHVFKSKTDYTGWFHEENLEEDDPIQPMIEDLGLDMDWDKNETLEVMELNLSQIQTI